MDNCIIYVNNLKLDALIAISDDEHAIGLMERKPPIPNMVFSFDDPGIYKFWMHNTFVPLDIIFCRNNKVLDIIKGKPMSDDFIGPNIASDLVIEMPSGMAGKYGINNSSTIIIELSRKTQLKKIINSFNKKTILI